MLNAGLVKGYRGLLYPTPLYCLANGELIMGFALTVLLKLSRFTDLGILVQYYKCTIIQLQQEYNPSLSTPYFAVPP
jgi:hypothetical protein